MQYKMFHSCLKPPSLEYLGTYAQHTGLDVQCPQLLSDYNKQMEHADTYL
jgi:hypothetical protein